MDFNWHVPLTEHARRVMTERVDRVDIDGSRVVGGVRKNSEGGRQLRFGHEQIEVDEVAFGGVGKDAGEEVGETFESDGFNADAIKESGDTASVGDDELVALAVKVGYDGERGEAGKERMLCAKAGVKGGKYELG